MITFVGGIILMIIQVMAKKQKDFLFDLKEGKSIQVDLSSKSDKDYCILYVRPQEDEKNSDLGEIQFKSADDTYKIEGFYESALFKQKSSEINLKCITSPCKGRITLVNSDVIDMTTQLQELSLSQKQPALIVQIMLPSQYDRLVGEFKLLDDESDKIKIEVFDDRAKLYGDEVQLSVALSSKDCEKCKVLVVLSGDLNFKEETTISSQLHLYKDIQDIEINQEIQDYLFERNENVYRIKLPSSYNIIQIGILGDLLPIIKVTDNKDSEIFNSYESIQIQQKGQAYHIHLRKAEINNNNELIIRINKGGPLKYLLVVKILDEPILYNNQIILATIIEKGSHIYSFKTSYSDQEIKVNLKYFEKGMNSIKVGECNGICTTNTEDTHNLRFHQHEQNPSVFLSPECSSKDQEGFCRFQIQIISEMKNTYLLTTVNEINRNIIKSDMPYSNFLEKQQQENLIVKYQHQIEDVELIFTVNTHNIVYMISKDSRCYPVRQECAKFIGGSDHLVILRGDQLKHTQFYVTLIARETTIYQFQIKVYKQQDIDVKIIKEDETYRGVLSFINGQQKIHYFRIIISNQIDQNIEIIQDKDTQPTIEFAIHSSRMQVALLFKKGNQLPSLEQYDLITQNNYLSISPQNQFYTNQGNCTIGILNIFDKVTDKEIMYTLTYSTSRTVKTLHIGQQFVDMAFGKKSKYFSFYYSRNASSFYISLQGKDTSKLILRVSNEISSNSQGEIYFKKEHSSTLFLEQLHLNKLCLDGLTEENNEEEDDSNNLLICQAYVIVENKAQEDILFQLNIWNPDANIEMKDGQQYQFNLEYLSKETFLYYKIISNDTDVQLHINSHYGYTRYQIEIVDTQNQQAVSLYAKEEYKTQHSKSIYKSAFEFCGKNCLLKISLEAKQQEYNISQINRSLDFDDLVYVTVTQEFMDIQTGIPIQIQVNQHSPRKFIYSQINEISQESKMKLVLHEIYGKGTICLSFNDEGNQDLETCEFQVLGNVLELTLQQIQQKLNELKLNQNPYIIIKVFSLVSTSKLQLSIEIYNDKNNHKLVLGVPTRIKMNAQEESFYQYFNIQSNDDLYFKFIKMQGSTYIEVSRCLDDSKIACESEIIINEQLLAGQSYSQHIIRKSDINRYCELCTYVIKVKTTVISLDLLIVITSQLNFVQLPQNIAFTDFLDGIDDYNIYHYSYDTDHQIEIQINQYNGDTQMWIGYHADLNTSNYLYGPYNTIKQMKLMNKTESVSYYQAIIPPRQHLEENDKDYNITQIQINGNQTLIGHYNDDDIYIIVKNNQQKQTNYSIIVTQSTTGNGQLLQDGIITSAYLSKLTPTITFYHQQKDQQQLQLFVKVNPYGNLNNLSFENYFKIEISNETNPTNYTIIHAFSIRNNQLTYIFPVLEGMLTIKMHSLLEISANDFNHIDYSFNPRGDIVPIPKQPQPKLYYFSNNYLNRIDIQISIVGQDVFMINQNSNQIDMIVDQKPKYYESYVQGDGKLAIQVYNCLGDLNVSITQDYDQFLKNTYNGTKTTLEGQLTDILLTVKPGPIYYQFQSNKSVYKFTTKLYNQFDKIPYGQLLLGGDGQINYFFGTTDPDIITIKFKPIKCAGCDMQQEHNSIIKYYVNWGSSIEYSHIIGLCQYHQYNNINKLQVEHFDQKDVGNYYLNQTEEIIVNITVDKQSLHNQLYISIRALVIQFNNMPVGDYELYYHIAEIGLPKNAFYMYKHRFYEFVIALSILVVFTFSMLCCLCFFYRKARNLKKQNLNMQLEQRMEDAKKKEQTEVQVGYDSFQDENNEQSNQ
ncbi:unnamed protein product [Paramecium primaurelia]|uniref:Transmembrane protein n=1 Tax=Paramecium primaurelia TaxID=5886 RepID=A0A8S1LTL5_PARPR|nr:unnamed protein product [Paramecium primaurelia]